MNNEQIATGTPYNNCAYVHCDLPGVCKGQGFCHHPKTGERDESTKVGQPEKLSTMSPDHFNQVDVHYFKSKLNLVIRDLHLYSRDELSRELFRLAKTAEPTPNAGASDE